MVNESRRAMMAAYGGEKAYKRWERKVDSKTKQLETEVRTGMSPSDFIKRRKDTPY